MPVIQGSAVIPLSSSNDNVLQGSQFEFLPYNAALEFGIVGDANAADLRVDAYSGQDVLCEQLQPSAAARIPLYPDDFNLTDVAARGERIKVRVRNLSAAASRTVFFAIRITPI